MAIRSKRQFESLTSRQQQAYGKARKALTGMRLSDVSLRAAAREAGTTPRTVQRYAGSALSKDRGRYRAKAGDRLYRPMRVITNVGVISVGVTGSRQASTIAQHHNAMARYLKHGDSSELASFRGVSVAGYELETDLDVIDERYDRGELDFENIYELVA